MKADATLTVPDGLFVSTDDVVTARIWKALVQCRCRQMGIATDDAETITTIARATNIRQRTAPKLG